MYKIEIYETENGKSEVKDYIKSLQEKNNKDSNIKLDFESIDRDETIKSFMEYLKKNDKDIY